MITIVLLVLWIFSAFYAVKSYFPGASSFERLAFGAATGLLGAAWTAFLVYVWAGHGVAVYLSLFVLPFFGMFFYYRLENRGAVRPLVPHFSFPGAARLAGALIWTGFWAWVSAKTIFTAPGGVYTADRFNYGDIQAHIAWTEYFAWGRHDLQNPLFSGLYLKYHFLIDFLAALFVREGLPLPAVFQAETFFFGVLLTALCGIFVKRVTGNEFCAWTAPVLLLAFSSAREIFSLSDPESRISLENFLVTRIIPQRSFLFGLPIAFCIFTLLWQAWEHEEGRPWRMPGFLAGLLPLASVYCFMVSAFVGGILSLFKGRRALANFLPAFLVAAIPQIFYIHKGGGAPAMSLMAGWHESARIGPLAFLKFWLGHTGALCPLVFFSLLFAPRRQAFFYVPFLFLFAAANVVRITPDMNNNYNLIYFAFAGAIPLLMGFFEAVWKLPRAGPALALFLFLTLTAGGVRQAYDTLNGARGAEKIVTAQDLEFSRKLREKSSPGDLVLVEPRNNFSVYWSGRRIFMGYSGWVWSHGWGDFVEREKIAKAVYEGESGAEKYLAEHQINLVVVGPKERAAYQVNEDFLRRRGGLLFDFPDYQVYRIRQA